MRGKLMPVIILLLLVVLCGVGVMIFKTITSDSGTGNGNNSGTENVLPQTVITLNKMPDENDSSKVIINAYATTEIEEGIMQIILPDGSTVDGDTASYTVEENGTYEFEVICNNGESKKETIEVTEIEKRSATNPYIPDGFTEIGGEIETGYTIQDKYGNEYVWIPVESGKMSRNTMLDIKYEESTSTSSALVNSVAQYYGFYIAKYEASQYELDGNIAAASMEGKNPWTNITCVDAAKYAENSANIFGYEDCKTALINSFAWDTTLKWIDQQVPGYSSSTNYGNYTGTIYPTGYTELDCVNNVCDLAGNVREWTTEFYKDSSTAPKDTTKHRVVRGGGASLGRTPVSHINYPENVSDNYWGFRTVLYK